MPHDDAGEMLASMAERVYSRGPHHITSDSPGLIITASYLLRRCPTTRLYTTQRCPEALRDHGDKIVLVEPQLATRLPITRKQELRLDGIVHPVPRAAIAAKGATYT